MAEKTENILRSVTPTKVILPIIIGFGIVGYLLYREWNAEALSMLSFSWFMLLFILLSFFMMALRDIGYIIRLRILSEGDISWKGIFNIIMLWEFASAVSPSAVGGTTVATYFIYKEGINLGRSTAIVLATAFLDELYFLIMFPLMYVAVGTSALFAVGGNVYNNSTSLFDNKYFYFAVIGYGIKFLFDLLVAYGLFINPRGIKTLLKTIFRLPFLKRWKQGAENTGNDLVIASELLRKKHLGFWLKAFAASVLSWTARYWVVNMLLLALIFGLPHLDSSVLFSFSEHILIFARQLVMWIMMLVMPSPGGSGFAEAVFSDYLGQFIPIGFVAIMAFLWRLVSYYPYLFMGIFVLPRWIRKVYTKKNIEG
jgi:uncharacterized membrane protein YbhN (UPF0104 family)